MQLDENGKPCRACNDMSEFQSMMAPIKGGDTPGNVALPTTTTNTTKQDQKMAYEEPPNSKQLGQSTWTFLHSVAAYYPPSATEEQQKEVRQLLNAVSHLYPCKPCAKDFERYLSKNEPKVDTRENFSLWLCDAHNAVNKKLGKQTFDCKLWKERWREGWEQFLKSQKK